MLRSFVSSCFVAALSNAVSLTETTVDEPQYNLLAESDVEKWEHADIVASKECIAKMNELPGRAGRPLEWDMDVYNIAKQHAGRVARGTRAKKYGPNECPECEKWASKNSVAYASNYNKNNGSDWGEAYTRAVGDWTRDGNNRMKMEHKGWTKAACAAIADETGKGGYHVTVSFVDAKGKDNFVTPSKKKKLSKAERKAKKAAKKAKKLAKKNKK